jgi:transcription termination factor Rho
MSERRRFRDRSQRSSGGGQASGQTRNGPNRGGQQNGQHRRQGGGGQGGGGGQHRGGGFNGQGGGRQEPAAPPVAAGATVEGLLSIRDENSDGVLRDPAYPLRPAPGGCVVPRQTIRDLNLRPGLLVRGVPNGRSLTKIDAVENGPPEEFRAKIPLYELTALDPAPVLKLEHDPAEMTTRVMDILTPVGFGQRGLIVAPPRTGKTILLQNLAKGIHHNYPNVELVLLLVDERPEEVTDMRRNVPGTVYASSNDNTIEKHLDLAQLVIERCKRQVEMGKDVVVLMDSLTRVGRAFNVGGPSGGRTMSGGLDNRALEIPKKLFGAARKVEGPGGTHGGSLTILATCLIDTGSRMDQVIFEEFKGTGNMELTLDRNLSNSRIYPAIDIAASGTRKEEKLLDAKQLLAARNIRRHLMNMPATQAMKSMLDALGKHKTNQAMFDTMRV